MSSRFSRRARRIQGGVAWLVIVVFVVGLAGCGGSSYQPPRPVGAGPLGAGAASWILEQLQGGISEYVQGDVCGWITSIIGGSDSDSAMQDAIDDMNSKLDTVITQLGVIEAQLNAVLLAIHVSTDVIKNNEQTLAMKNPQDIINNVFSNLQALNKSMIGNPTGQAKAVDLANDIVSTSRSNIDQQIYDIYSGVMGLTSGLDGGALNAFTDTLVDQDSGSTPPTVLSQYQALESYFKQLVEVQLKGATLMVEGLHQRDEPPPSSAKAGVRGSQARLTAARKGSSAGRAAARKDVGDYPGDAEQWMNQKFLPYMAAEVEEFLRCADRIVLAQCDLRTDITTTNPAVNMLPAGADTVWSRADFIAAQISTSRHGFGLNVRLAGEPDEIQGGGEIYQSAPGTETIMTRVPLGVTPAPVRLNPVETWLNWPAGNAKQWLQWNWGSYNTGSKTVSGHIKFNPTTNIAVAKYNANSPGGASQYVFTNYANEQAAIGSPGNYVPLMNWYDGDMNIVKAGTAGAVYYGHGTLTIRHRPEVWYQYRSDANGGDVYTTTADCYLGPNVWVRSLATLKQNYWGVDETFDVSSAIAIPIINGDVSGHQLRVNGNLQADANNGFAGRVSVNQNRITGWWEWNNEPEWDWWDVQWGNPVSYGGTGAYHNFDPGEAFTYAIMVRIACNASGNKGNALGCRVWPQVLNLYL